MSDVASIFAGIAIAGLLSAFIGCSLYLSTPDKSGFNVASVIMYICIFLLVIYLLETIGFIPAIDGSMPVTGPFLLAFIGLIITSFVSSLAGLFLATLVMLECKLVHSEKYPKEKEVCERSV